jgi:uncharacterized protein (DUF697 family)
MAAKADVRISTDPNRPTNEEGTSSRNQETALERIARRIIKRKAFWSAGIGLVPVPIIDFVGVTAVQISMLRELCDLYGIPYHEDRAREWTGALLGSLTPTLVKTIPGVGTIAGMLTSPAYYGAATYALGRVFVQHFETGGTLLSFDADRMRGHFQAYYREGREHGGGRTAGVSAGTASSSSNPL